MRGGEGKKQTLFPNLLKAEEEKGRPLKGRYRLWVRLMERYRNVSMVVAVLLVGDTCRCRGDRPGLVEPLQWSSLPAAGLVRSAAVLGSLNNLTQKRQPILRLVQVYLKAATPSHCQKAHEAVPSSGIVFAFLPHCSQQSRPARPWLSDPRMPCWLCYVYARLCMEQQGQPNHTQAEQPRNTGTPNERNVPKDKLCLRR
jgi:hypothetical protein